MSDKKTVDKKDDKHDELIGIDDNEFGNEKFEDVIVALSFSR